MTCPPPAPPHSRQLRLPVFPSDSIQVSEQISVSRREGTVWYFHYDQPVFSHEEVDLASFRMFTSSLCDKGLCSSAEVRRAFQVSKIGVARALKQYRTQGVASFFAPKKAVQRKARVLRDETGKQVQDLLSAGQTPRQIEEQIGVKADTIRRAITSGRLHRPEKKGPLKN